VNKKVWVLDRSGAETADKCPRAYWWNRLATGSGVVPIDTPEALYVGRDVHEDLQAIAERDDLSIAGITEAVERGLGDALKDLSDKDQIKRELAYRRFGWASAFALFIEPKIRAKWITIGSERELILDRDPLWVPVTPDRVLQSIDKPDLRVYREYKSTISASGKWLSSWRKKPQLHLGMKALEEDGTKVAYAQVMGLMKGQVRDGRLSHPYVWAYHNHSTGKWTHDYSLARASGWGPEPVWNYPGGLVEWVRQCGEEVAAAQFPHTEPVFLNEQLLESWITRWTAQMEEWAMAEEMCRQDAEARDIFFPQHTDNCEPPFGDPCSYRWACWNAGVNRDPIGSGYYVKRIPHHDVELILGGRK
jgi:hypothetical protein